MTQRHIFVKLMLVTVNEGIAYAEQKMKLGFQVLICFPQPSNILGFLADWAVLACFLDREMSVLQEDWDGAVYEGGIPMRLEIEEYGRERKDRFWQYAT